MGGDEFCALLEGPPEARAQLLKTAARALAETGDGFAIGCSYGAVALSLGLSAEEAEQVERAAELHDVGKVAIPDAILDKPGPLDESEWAFIHRHTLIGERIVAAAPDLRSIASLVRNSHENYDGSGYPDALASDAIPLGSRIIAVCDAFDAMTTDRPYRTGLSEEAAIAELRRCSGTQFDPRVVESFCEVLRARRGALRSAA